MAYPLYRFVITFSCWPHIAFTYGSNAATAATAYREALRAWRPEINRSTRGCHMVEVNDRLFDLTRRFGAESDRPDFGFPSAVH